MKINIRCDMEGVMGVTSYDQVVPGAARYAEGRALLERELLAVLEGIFAVEPDAEIIVFDEHYDGRNVDVARLPEGVQYVSGKPPYVKGCAGFIEGCDAMFLLGFHAMAGTPNAVLPHTYEHDILALEVNGDRLGEVGLESLIAAEAGVPTIFYSGDSAGAKEASAISPGIVTVVTKESVSESAAICYSGASVVRRLREGARNALLALRSGKFASPPRPELPCRLRIELQQNKYRELLYGSFPSVFDEEGWVSIVRSSITECFVEYWRMKDETLRQLRSRQHRQ